MHGVEIFVRDQNSPEAELGARHLLQYNCLSEYAWTATRLDATLPGLLSRPARADPETVCIRSYELGPRSTRAY